jgi:hypothetical protein
MDVVWVATDDDCYAIISSGGALNFCSNSDDYTPLS